MTDKRMLRAAARTARESFVAAGVPALPCPHEFVALLAPGMVVASYAPIGSEADPAALEAAARAAGCRLALPHVVDRATPIRFLAWDADHALADGPFGLRQPDGAHAEVVPDLVLTPLVAFDAALNRIGQGAGHYDRAFAAFPAALRIGIAWSVQQLDSITPDPWDAPLDAIVTERGWIAGAAR
ncbi:MULTISPECIES: 5-formyltetrahydrofolate cyclo-ligase [unclassified Sphingomonas]|uniref:5-formyltetrahydrofolate cyclo-ligase n=1 Tax=unclassified Sphingomonas TaxID=196159 RepID=UPI0016088AC7|nr:MULTISPECIES: 5-formyltetrahydrofolate cyclo-ligase [unclassified Sphingomonas]MBB3346698.1 5-formyltetrahydrofolate cyclo-ligase [Sphingomonas sp. BK069]MBB3472985.1 5-formyltetrahydrofolate cyclo-ligase [Sphingomonas sp. BK345]